MSTVVITPQRKANAFVKLSDAMLPQALVSKAVSINPNIKSVRLRHYNAVRVGRLGMTMIIRYITVSCDKGYIGIIELDS